MGSEASGQLPGDRCLNRSFLVAVDDDSILRSLLLNQNHTLCPSTHKVSAWIQRTLQHLCELFLRLSCQSTISTLEHDRHPSNRYSFFDTQHIGASVSNIDSYGCGIRHVTQTTFMRGDFVEDQLFLDDRLADTDREKSAGLENSTIQTRSRIWGRCQR